MKIKNFMKYFKEGVLKYFKISIFQNFHEIFKYFKVKYFIVHPYRYEMSEVCPRASEDA